MEPTDRKRPFSLITPQPVSQTIEKTSKDSPLVTLVKQQQKKKRTNAPCTVKPETKELLALITSLYGSETSRLITVTIRSKTEAAHQTSVAKPNPQPNPWMPLGTLEWKIPSPPEPVMDPYFQRREVCLQTSRPRPLEMKQVRVWLTNSLVLPGRNCYHLNHTHQ